MKAKPIFLGLLLLFLIAAPPSKASFVLSPTEVIDPKPGHSASYATIENTFNRSGLIYGFDSGDTDWDDYFSGKLGDTRHQGNTAYEWFGPMGTKVSTFVYDLGGTYDIDQIALWNEADVGISQFTVWLSHSPDIADGYSFTDTFYPANTPVDPTDVNAPYAAELFSLGGPAYEGRYVHFHGIGNDDYYGLNWISMGEIAFSATTAHAPLPPAAFLLFSGLLGIASFRRFKR